LSGRPARAIRLDPDARLLALDLSGEALLLELHPARGGIRFGPPPATPGILRLPSRARVGGVSAPPDERLLHLRLAGVKPIPGRPRSLVVELLTNQWNALVLDA